MSASVIVLTSVMKDAACGQQTTRSDEVPLFDDGAILRVPVKMFGQTLYFVLDTGTSVSALDVSFREKLGSPMSEVVNGVSAALEKKLILYKCPDFSVGDTRANLKQITSVDLSTVRKVSGERCDGILAMDFLTNNVISLNFDSRILKIATEVSGATKRESVALPLTQVSNKQVTIDAMVNLIIPLKLVIDTGESWAMALNQDDWKAVFPAGARKDGASTKSAMLGVGTVSVPIARIDSLEIGPNRYAGVLCSFNAMRESRSHVGLAFLRRHFVTLNFPNRTLYLARGGHFSDVDEPDMSGLHLIREGDQTLVYSVDANSAAADVGIQAGDILLSINSQNVAQMKMKDVRERFKTKDGDKVAVEFTRGAQAKRIVLTLTKSL